MLVWTWACRAKISNGFEIGISQACGVAVQGEVSKCFVGVEGREGDKLLQLARRDIPLTTLSGNIVHRPRRFEAY